MRSIVALFLALVVGIAAPSQARETYTVIVEEWVEEGAGRYLPSQPPVLSPALASFGPFRVLAEDRAALVEATDAASPQAFAAMLRSFPEVAVIEMIDCPGTLDDAANLRLGRMIRAAGLATLVPRGGSVRSGAVELFLAGAQRRIEDGSEFAVHAWKDEHGREPDDFDPGAAVNRTYLDYYVEMGMDEARARAFYDMTNSVPHDGALWLDGEEMRVWIEGRGEQPAPRDPQLAYLDLAQSLP